MVGVGTLMIMVATQVSAANKSCKINFFVSYFPSSFSYLVKVLLFVRVTEYHYMHNWLCENNHFKQIRPYQIKNTENLEKY